MKKLAIMTMGALLTAGAVNAQTAGTPDTRGVNRTGQAERGAADMETGAATTPGTGVDTTDQVGPGTTPPAEPAPGADPFEGIQPADPVTDPADQPGITQPVAPDADRWEETQPMQPVDPQADRWEQQVQPADPQVGVQPTDPIGVQPADPTWEADPYAARTMPAVASNWLGMLFGGGLLSAAGFALRRKRK